MNRFQTVLSALCLAANAASAEPVMLRGSELGQGFTFSHRGNCYVVFPQHVTSRRARLQVVAEGAVTGFASPRFPFWPGIDLAVGSVARDAARRCTRTIDDLEPPARALSPSGRGNLVLVDVEGNVTRLPMRITRIDYLEFEATFETAGNTTAIQGMSGAFLFVDDRPVGMALETTDAGGIRFMRIEELHMNLSRWLGTQRAVGFSDTTAADPPAQQTDDSLKLTVLSASATATGIGRPRSWSRKPVAITAQTPIEPTARFIPPVARTTICEKPMTMSTASERPRLKRLKVERKPGASDEKITHRMTTMASRPIWPDAPPRLSRRRTGVSRIASSLIRGPLCSSHSAPGGMSGTERSVPDEAG